MKPALVVLLALGLLSVVTSAAAEPVRKLLEDKDTAEYAGKLAADFCKSPDIKKLKCGWATEEEDRKTVVTGNRDSFNRHAGPLKEPLPHKMNAGESWFASRYFKAVSLACRPGKLTVRAVFKVLSDTGLAKDFHDGSSPVVLMGDYNLEPLGSNLSPEHRCELQLPSHDTSTAKGETSKGEIEAALKSKEVNCKPAKNFPKLNISSWYSDTYTFDWAGCSGVSKPGFKYYQTRPSINQSRMHSILLAKFEVQEAP